MRLLRNTDPLDLAFGVLMILSCLVGVILFCHDCSRTLR